MRTFSALALVALLLTACEKNSTPVPSNTPVENNNASKPAIKAPAGVPDSVKNRFNQLWPGIEKSGGVFLAKFNEAKSAQAAGNRVKLAAAIAAAQVAYSQFNEKWGEFYGSVQDMEDDGKLDEASAEKTYRFLKPYNQKVTGWTKMAKPLKEMSTVK